MDETASVTARRWRALYRIRRVEERLADLYSTDVIQSPMHLSIGQEWIAVGVCEHLRPGDVVFGTYRGHAMYLARGGSLRGMLRELFGRDDGCCRGVGGSMHLADVAAGIMPASAVVGTTVPVAVGYAYAQHVRHTSAMTVVFFGDGATEEGVFHESLNFAALHHLDVLFVCENNGYAIHTSIDARRGSGHAILDHLAPYQIVGRGIAYGDLDALSEFAQGAIQQSGQHLGPWFVECQTYRWRQHVGPEDDFEAGYRSREEAQPFIDHDPLSIMAASLDAASLVRIRHEVDAELDAMFEETPSGSGDSR